MTVQHLHSEKIDLENMKEKVSEFLDHFVLNLCTNDSMGASNQSLIDKESIDIHCFIVCTTGERIFFVRQHLSV